MCFINLYLSLTDDPNSGQLSSSPRFVYCLLIRVIVLYVSRVKEDGLRYKKMINPRQFTNGRKKEKDSRALFCKRVGNKEALHVTQLVLLVCDLKQFKHQYFD